MRDIRAIQFERRIAGPGVPVPGTVMPEPDATTPPQPNQDVPTNALPLESQLPQFYQQLEQRGQVPPAGVQAILKDLVDRVNNLESETGDQGDENGPSVPPQPEEGAPVEKEEPTNVEKPKK